MLPHNLQTAPNPLQIEIKIEENTLLEANPRDEPVFDIGDQ